MRRAISLLLVFVLLCLLLPIPVSGAVSLSFIAVNDTIPLTLSGDQRPYYSGGLLYVPYTVFNASALGFYPSYSASDKNLTLFSRDKRLVFDLTAGTVTDETKLTQAVSTISKNGTVFLPAAFCAGHFGVNTSELTSLGGYQLVRFTTGSQVYDDSLFVEKAENLIVYRVSQFLTSTAPDATGTPASPIKPTTPAALPKPEQPEAQPVNISLALTGAEDLGAELTVLSQYKLKATFFLTAEEIAKNSDLVRRIASEGHYIGLTPADESQDAAAQLQAANEALDLATQSKSLLVLLPEAARLPELEESYRVFTRPEVRLTATQAAKASGQSRLLICDEKTLAESLYILKNANAEFSPLRETSPLA